MNLEINMNNTFEKTEVNLEKDLEDLLEDELKKKTNHEDVINFDNELAQQLDYKTNYNLNNLRIIAEYYGISSRKLKKDELIIKIVEYENDLLNLGKVERRKRLWENIIELKNDTFFSKFIII